jgi:hypothetical protein
MTLDTWRPTTVEHTQLQPGQPWTSEFGQARILGVPAHQQAGPTVLARWETGPAAPARFALPLADFVDVFDGPVTT